MEFHILQGVYRRENCLNSVMVDSFLGVMKSGLFYAEKIESVENFTKVLDDLCFVIQNIGEVARSDGGVRKLPATTKITGSSNLSLCVAQRYRGSARRARGLNSL